MKKFPNLLAPRPPPTSSVAPSISSNVLEKKAQHDGRRCLCPINLRVTSASDLSGGTARLVTRVIEQYRRNYLFSWRSAVSIVRDQFPLRMNEFHGDVRFGEMHRRRSMVNDGEKEMEIQSQSTANGCVLGERRRGNRRRHQLRILRPSGNLLTFPFLLEKLTRRGRAEARNKHLFKRSRQVTAINTYESLILSSVAPVFR